MVSLYPDWFKYPVIRISYPFGLLSYAIGNRKSNSEEIILSTNNIHNNYYNRYFDTAFFIEPYVEKGKERKERIKTHHNNILDIFKKWGHTHVEPVCQISCLYKKRCTTRSKSC